MKDQILIISNNVLSTTTNNGKTILSFFSQFPSENIHQLFFSNECIELNQYDYFRITDKNMLYKFVHKNIVESIENSKINVEKKSNEQNKRYSIPRNSLTLLIRDLIWHGRWKSENLERWLDNINPTVVFFVAGDTFFSYEICSYIVKKYNANLSVFFTDDYVLKYISDTPMKLLRKLFIEKAIRAVLCMRAKVFTISEYMKIVYDKKFNINSIPLVNIPNITSSTMNMIRAESYDLIYAGSLYYGRDKVLKNLVKILAKIDNVEGRKMLLHIYSRDQFQVSNKFIHKYGAFFKYEGVVSASLLQPVLSAADILVFVESFLLRNIKKTKLSLSTKVPEYMSYKKPIIAIGPYEVGSMQYLKDIAFCMNKIKKNNICSFLADEKEKEKYADLAFKKYLKNHNKVDQLELFKNRLLSYEN